MFMDREIALLAAAKQMDNVALGEIFEIYAPALYKYAFRLCNNAVTADQFVGDVFDRFIQQLSTGKKPGIGLRSYLYEIAYRLLMQDVRFTSYFPAADGAVSRQNRWMFSDMDSDDKRLFEAIQRAILMDLTNDQRHVIILRFVEGFSLKETAGITGKTVNNVKVIQNRGMAALRKALDYQAVEATTITFFLRRMAQA
jgi:RNA polymerase sigma-70 factor (ECF subfamily)